jgi:hypothetical protein
MDLTGKIKLRPYQLDIVDKGIKQLLQRRWCYLSMEVRTGKTLTALSIASKLGGKHKRVVFVTKLKAFDSIKNDIDLLQDSSIYVDIVNYESLHKLDLSVHVDCWILDEAHKLGGFPKPCEKSKLLKQIIHKHSMVIFLSGTPTPESGSQIFHQLYVLGDKSPFVGFNFYQWAKDNVNIKKRYLGYAEVNDYSDCKFNLDSLNFLSFSQKQAGFKNEIREHFVKVDMSEMTKKIISTLKKDKIFKGKNDVILADTSVKEMQKIHQLSSGTCILDESQEGIIIDKTKAQFIQDNFSDKKIAIFYKFKMELEMLKEFFDVTDNVEEFNNTNKVLCLQFVSGREGTKLNKADMLIYFNIDFSATTYFQARDRMTTIDREVSDIYYLISDCGIEMDVYKAVSNKKNYTLRFYEGKSVSSENNKEAGSSGILFN